MIGVISFKKDPYSILKSTLMRVPFLLAALVGAFLWADPTWQSLALYSVPMVLLTMNGAGSMLLGLFLGMGIVIYDQGVSSSDVVYAVAAILITFPVTSLYHSASHLSLRPRFMNRLVGEAFGFFHNMGIDIWSVTHHYHHKHTDIPGLDPHPIQGQGFWEFAKVTGRTLTEAFSLHYFKCHSRTPKTERAHKLMLLNFVVRNPLVTLIWFLALGPRGFVYFYVVNLVFKRFHYAWFNWVTHRKKDDNVETENLSGGAYRFINAISFNLYYHHNHHKYPNLMNPKKVPASFLRSKEKSVA